MTVDDELPPGDDETGALVPVGSDRPPGNRRTRFVASALAVAFVGAATGGILAVALAQDGPLAPAASGDAAGSRSGKRIRRQTPRGS